VPNRKLGAVSRACAGRVAAQRYLVEPGLRAAHTRDHCASWVSRMKSGPAVRATDPARGHDDEGPDRDGGAFVVVSAPVPGVDPSEEHDEQGD
jgi:hypothetical protein